MKSDLHLGNQKVTCLEEAGTMNLICQSCHEKINEHKNGFNLHMSSDQNPGCLGYIGDYTAQLIPVV